jgi:hypothetical protein
MRSVASLMSRIRGDADSGEGSRQFSGERPRNICSRWRLRAHFACVLSCLVDAAPVMQRRSGRPGSSGAAWRLLCRQT